MAASRLWATLTVGRHAYRAFGQRSRGLCTSTPKNSTGGSFKYRSPPNPPSGLDVYIAEAFGGVAWWWVLWHLWTEPEHLLGEHYLPDPSKWTDAELGIPPDEED